MDMTSTDPWLVGSGSRTEQMNEYYLFLSLQYNGVDLP